MENVFFHDTKTGALRTAENGQALIRVERQIEIR